MICGNLLLKILLLFSLISTVCGTFEVNATQTYYQAEENEDITLEFVFTTKADSSPVEIYCELLADDEHLVVFHLHDGEEFLWSQNQQFAGRVQYDKDLLREGRFRLNVSRLGTRDSGLYLCTVVTSYGDSYGGNTGRCSLNVTAARHLLEPEIPMTSQPEPGSRGRAGLYWALGLAGVALLVFCCLVCWQCLPRKQDSIDHTRPNQQESVIVCLPEGDSVILTPPKGQDSHSDKSYSSGYGGEEMD